MNSYFIRALTTLALCCAIVLFAVSCAPVTDEPSAPTDRESTDQPQPALTAPEDLTVILHAGGAIDGMTYLNAQESFLIYYEQGYRYFEYDFTLSTDGRLIGTHDGEHLGDCDPFCMTYAEFCELRLDGGYTPVNEEWLIDTLRQYPDVKIVVDAKMPTTEQDAEVLIRLEALESVCGIDLSANIIPEVFSAEMWDVLCKHTTFDQYMFSQYKVHYTVDTMLEHFSDDRIRGIALSTYVDGDIRSELWRVQQADKEIWVFTCLDGQDVADAIAMGASGVYVDSPDVLSQ